MKQVKATFPPEFIKDFPSIAKQLQKEIDKVGIDITKPFKMETYWAFDEDFTRNQITLKVTQ